MVYMPNKDAIEKKYAEALAGLAANCKPVAGYAQPVLHEGGRLRSILLPGCHSWGQSSE